MNRKNFGAEKKRIKPTKNFSNQNTLDCEKLLKELKEEYRRDHPEKFKKKRYKNKNKNKNRYNNNNRYDNNKKGAKENAK